MLSGAQQMKRLYEKQFGDTCRKYRISQNEADILAFLANNPGYDTARDIVEVRMIAKSYISRSVESLIRKGLLVRAPDEDDRRIVHLRLTDGSRPIVAETRLGQRRFAKLLFAGMDADQIATLETLLGRIFDNANQANKGSV